MRVPCPIATFLSEYNVQTDPVNSLHSEVTGLPHLCMFRTHDLYFNVDPVVQ